ARVRVERRLAAEVRVEHLRPGLDAAGPDEIDECGHRLPLVNRVGEHPLEPRAEADRVDCLLVGNAVRASVPLLEQDDLVVAKQALETDCVSRATGDSCNLIP